MKNFTIILASLLCVACASARQVTPSENTRVEIRTETIFQKDTVYLELPVIVKKVQTLDTMSMLENRYAKSEAVVTDGVLVHSLATKPVKEPVQVETKVVYRDSLVYVDKIVKETMEVAKPLLMFHTSILQAMKYIPSIAFEEMSGSAKGVIADLKFVIMASVPQSNGVTKACSKVGEKSGKMLRQISL